MTNPAGGPAGFNCRTVCLFGVPVGMYLLPVRLQEMVAVLGTAFPVPPIPLKGWKSSNKSS